VQLTPPGSACSITIGTGIGAGEPGTLRGLHLVVEPDRADYGSYVFFTDPDGNTWAVQEVRGQH